jgi:hypothetical protein
MVNYHTLLLHGREPVRTALIDSWADDGLTGAERVRLLSHLCSENRGNTARFRCASPRTPTHAVYEPRLQLDR